MNAQDVNLMNGFQQLGRAGRQAMLFLGAHVCTGREGWVLHRRRFSKDERGCASRLNGGDQGDTGRALKSIRSRTGSAKAPKIQGSFMNRWRAVQMGGRKLYLVHFFLFFSVSTFFPFRWVSWLSGVLARRHSYR